MRCAILTDAMVLRSFDGLTSDKIVRMNTHEMSIDSKRTCGKRDGALKTQGALALKTQDTCAPKARSVQAQVDIVGAGLAGSEAALQLADRGVAVRLFEMRPTRQTAVHQTEKCAELVCSNSLKSEKPESAAGMLKAELAALGSQLLACAHECRVAAGGALAVDRELFAAAVSARIEAHPHITLLREEVRRIPTDADATIVASGPLTSDDLAEDIAALTGSQHLAFYDAAAPIVMTDSLDQSRLFRQNRYECGVGKGTGAGGAGESAGKDPGEGTGPGANADERAGTGDYLNAPFSRDEYERFIAELVAADRVVLKDFETKELFQACQPIEEIARNGLDAPRFGPLKPVGLIDPASGRRPWAALQLRAEDAHGLSYNLVGFQTNLSFSEQRRVFRMIPGLEQAEFARYGVMHRNTFIDAPRLLGPDMRLKTSNEQSVYFAGQISGTEGYCEAIMSGLYAALCVWAQLTGKEVPVLPPETAFGALLTYSTNPEVQDYQPMHVNFGIMLPLAEPVRNKRLRYAAYASRGRDALMAYRAQLIQRGILSAV